METTKNLQTKKIAILAMLCAIAYVVLFLSKLIPLNVAGFLNFDLKDVVVVITGFIFGPLEALLVTVVVSFIEMITISSTGPWGLLMNILSTAAFACSAAMIYKRKHTQLGAVLGLIVAVILTTGIMILWNYVVTPIYMGVPRPVVAAMLLPTFLPYNLVKYTINGALALLVYKPIVNALRSAKLLPEGKGKTVGIKKSNTAFYIIAAIVFVGALFAFLILAGVFSK